MSKFANQKELILEEAFDDKGLDMREITSKPLDAVLEAMERYATACVKASLEKAAKRVSFNWSTSISQEDGMKSEVSSAENIVLL